MTSRDRLVVIVLAAAALLGAFWFFMLSPQRKQASDVRAKVTEQEQRLTKARDAVAAAQQAKARYNADYAAVAALGQAVPADDDVPSLIVQVDRAAEREGVSFRSLSLTSSGSAQPAPAPAPAPAPPATGADKDKAGSDSAAPAAPTQAAASSLPPGASVGPAGFPTMPFAFEFTGSFFRLEDFLHRLNDFTSMRSGGDIAVRGRLLSVDAFDLKAAASGFPKVAASVKATAFVLPPGQGLTAGATAAGPAGADAAAATTPATPSEGAGSTPKPTAAALMLSGGRR